MITYDLSLCIGASKQGKKAIVKCHDTGIQFLVKLFFFRHQQWREVNEPYNIPEGATAMIKVAKPDKTFVVQDGRITSDGIRFEMPPQTFTVNGVSIAEVSIYDANGRRVTTASFSVEVDSEAICDCTEESKTFVDAVGQQVREANYAADRAEEAARRAEEAGGGGAGSMTEEDFERLEEYINAQVGTHANNRENPHKVTARQVGATTEDDVLLLIPQSEAVKEIQSDVRGLQEQTELTKADIEGLQKQINEEAHFRGYMSTNAKIEALEATPNDFAYSAESGTKWIYDAENGWQDTGMPVPDQLTPASNATPLMNGTASAGSSDKYARGDHRHPTDTTRVSVEEFNALKSDLGSALDSILAIQNELIGG